MNYCFNIIILVEMHKMRYFYWKIAKIVSGGWELCPQTLAQPPPLRNPDYTTVYLFGKSRSLITVKNYRVWHKFDINLETNTFQFCIIEYCTICGHFTSWPSSWFDSCSRTWGASVWEAFSYQRLGGFAPQTLVWKNI